MKLLPFISYCTLKGFVTEHREIEKPVWDYKADKYFKIELEGRMYNASIRYALINEQAVIVTCSLYDLGHRNLLNGSYSGKIISCPGLKDLKNAFIPKKNLLLK